MDHAWTLEPAGDGRTAGTCSCGYAVIGGSDADVTANLDEHVAREA